ncbi:MAG TPA: histidine kinase dimerization/phospho-acceptor domain-containing protein, partial [Anaerovoracaceae bacterium]|nr:histidine kinase dimerization/phospho-acceptor domain-containing protein [Anaerovoracaceae bacterium]
MKKVSLSVYEKIGFEYKITFLYFVIGFLWILLSDTFFDFLIQDKDVLTKLQIVKGFFYISITSLLLFFLIKNHVKVLSLAKEKAEENDRLKSAFLANMSHEIRTPMNGILGFAEILKEPDLSGEEQQECISVIQKSGIRMLNIINDIICISKVEAGQMEIVVSETDINEQVEYIYTFCKPEVEAKGMRLIMKKGLSSQDAIIRTDREKLYAILTNLVKNAVKYS